MGDYVGKHEDATSVYDGIVAEILSDKIARTQKFLRTHEVRNNGQAVLKDKRKNYRSRKIRYFDRDLDDRFPNKGKSMYMTIQKYRDDTDERISYAELLPDEEHYVGSTNLSHAINRYGKMLAEIRKPLEDNGCFCATNYYADSWSCSAEKHEYPQKYYDLLFRMQDIQAYQEVLMKEKLGQFTGICGPEMNSLWYYAHEAINYLNTMKGEC